MLCKGSVVVVRMVMLVFSLQRRISMQCASLLIRVRRDMSDLGLFLGHGVGNGG